MQLALFAAPCPTIPGLTYVEEFCTADEERELIEQVDRHPWSHEYQRRRQHHGIRYEDRVARPFEPLPGWILPIAERLVERGHFPRLPEGCLVNEYLPGQGIAAHVDRVFAGPMVASLSLSSGCVMDLTSVTDGARHHALWLARRSLLVLSGEARRSWRHGIAARKSDHVAEQPIARGRRVSLTLRLRG